MTNDTTERKLFKDFFDASLVKFLGDRLHRLDTRFDVHGFCEAASDDLDSLEMKARVARIAAAMIAALPGPVANDLQLLIAALPAPADSAEGVTSNGFRWWPFSDVIATHGLSEPDVAFSAMVALTRCFTSEFAIRPHLAADLDGTLARLENLVGHPDQHVRRWVSEGTRTRLPWGARVPGLLEARDRRVALLDALRHDPERYVQRSVANHVADILKDDADFGLRLLARWQREDHPGTRWIVGHAARDILKKGHPDALALFGFAGGRDLPIDVVSFHTTPTTVAVGDIVQLQATLVNRGAAPIRLRIDYALNAPTATDRLSRKVFRWSDRVLVAGEQLDIKTKYAFVSRTIRAVRAGQHRFELIVNGTVMSASIIVCHSV